jgi:malate synthase
VLLDALDFDHAREFLTAEVTAQQWTQQTDHETNARWYLRFAIGKILRHRSLSRRKGRSTSWVSSPGCSTATTSCPQWTKPATQRTARRKSPHSPTGSAGLSATRSPTRTTRGALARMAHGSECDPDGCPRCGQ